MIVHRGTLRNGRVSVSCTGQPARDLRPAEYVSLTSRVNCTDCLSRLAWVGVAGDGLVDFGQTPVLHWPARS